MASTRQDQLNSEELTTASHNYGGGLNSYAFFKLRDRAVGEDMVQDTFLKTWSYLAKGGKIVLMKAFLYHVLNNLIIDEYRKKKHKADSLDTLLENGFEPKDEESDRMTDVLDGKAAMRRIADLPQVYRRVMNMRFVQSMSLKDISIATGTKQNAISVQIHRGVKKLRALCAPKP